MATKKVVLADVNGQIDETNLLLRRVVKLLESSAVVDSASRQRVVVDSIPTILSYYLTGAGGAQWPTSGPPLFSTSSLYTMPVWEGPVDQRWRVMEESHVSYSQNIRSKLTFS